MRGSDRKDDAALMRLRHGTAAEQADLTAAADRDPALRKDLETWNRQDAALHALYDPVAKEPVPARQGALLMQVERAGGTPPRWRRIAAVLALLLVANASGGGLGYHLATVRAPGVDLVSAAFRAYATYTPKAAHPVEVTASEDPHLSGWLSNRLGRRIAVPDLGPHGFTLMGARVLPGANGPAVMIMYRDDQGRRLTLYIATASDREESRFAFVQRDSVRSYWWFDDDLGCALVGDLTREALHDIAVDTYEQITGA